MYNFKVCTTVFYTLGYICAMESPRGENDIYMRRHDVKRKSGMNAVNGVRKLPDLYWNTSNPMFRIDNTDHIIDVNLHQSGKTLRDYDQINIICPTYNQNRISDKSIIERFIIYHVTKEEYDSCRILHPRPRIIAQCKSPFRKLFFTISFRSFSPTPGALEFKPGFDYHFISTSSKEDVNQLEFGMCHTNNMKIVFKIAENVENKPNNLYLNTKRKSYKSDKSNFNNGSFDLMKSKQKFPKSLDYYLYPNKLDVNQDKGVFKQEASTSKASAFTCFNELSLKSQISFLLYFILIVL